MVSNQCQKSRLCMCDSKNKSDQLNKKYGHNIGQNNIGIGIKRLSYSTHCLSLHNLKLKDNTYRCWCSNRKFIHLNNQWLSSMAYIAHKIHQCNKVHMANPHSLKMQYTKHIYHPNILTLGRCNLYYLSIHNSQSKDYRYCLPHWYIKKKMCISHTNRQQGYKFMFHIDLFSHLQHIKRIYPS